MNDPLHPGVVRPTDTVEEPADVQDLRPAWLRILDSLRPTADLEIDKRTRKPIGTIGVKGHVDF